MKPVALAEALNIILEAVSLPGSETISVRDALGRVLARDLPLERDFPDLPRSAVDGFAVQSGMKRQFKVVTEVAAGHLPDRKLQPGEAAAVMTGGVVPEGADCVVMLEECRREGTQLTVGITCRPGDMINPAGSEAAAGTLLASTGQRIGPGLFPALFCAGWAEVPVFRQPRVGILATGDELREVEDGHQPGMVFNTNRYIVEAVCTGLGLPCEVLPAVGDRPEAVTAALDDLCSRCDFVVTSGGVSVGRYDFVRRVLEDDPQDLLLAGTRIKPGRPLHVARRQSALVFAMPGYPAALLTNAFLYLAPALKKGMGRSDHASRWFTATTLNGFRGRPGRQYLARARLALRDGRWTATDPGSQFSSHFLNFAEVNGLVRLPLQVETSLVEADGSYTLPPGAEVDVLHFDLELA
jgi:molybdopterin molybdotransferase